MYGTVGNFPPNVQRHRSGADMDQIRSIRMNGVLRFALGGFVLTCLMAAGAFWFTADLRDQETLLLDTHEIMTAESPSDGPDPMPALISGLISDTDRFLFLSLGSFVLFYFGAVALFAYEVHRRRKLEEQIATVQRNEHFGLMAAGDRPRLQQHAPGDFRQRLPRRI